MEQAIRRIVRRNIRNRRLQLEMSQDDLAEKLGLTQSWIAQIEAPSRPERPSLEQLDLLAKALKAKAYQLLTPDFFTGYSKDGDDLRGRR